MRLEITRVEGLRNDLTLRLERTEIDRALMSVANRDRLLALPGIPRHRRASAAERDALDAAKLPLQAHLPPLGIVDASGRARLRAVVISNRNLGTNHGHVAWQRDARPRMFRVREDPLGNEPRSCLVAWRDGRLTIDDLVFDAASDRLRRPDGTDVSDAVEWATYGQQVLRRGSVTPIETIAPEFYDARHVFAFDPRREQGERIRARIYDGYPDAFRANVLRAWRDGAPRARYFHNAIGLSSGGLVVIQREGTIEEIGAALNDAGADDGLILDNGGSVACWAWWVNDYAGGIVSPTVDYRPPGTSAIAFVLNGPLNVDLPGSSVSYSTY
jgi:hypothetical protein